MPGHHLRGIKRPLEEVAKFTGNGSGLVRKKFAKSLFGEETVARFSTEVVNGLIGLLIKKSVIHKEFELSCIAPTMMRMLSAEQRAAVIQKNAEEKAKVLTAAKQVGITVTPDLNLEVEFMRLLYEDAQARAAANSGEVAKRKAGGAK